MKREEKQHKIEVHVSGICFRETGYDIEILIAKRQNDRQIYPGKWECSGGQVFIGEDFETAIKRKVKEELGIIIKRSVVFRVYSIQAPEISQKVIPGVKFICFWEDYINGKEPQIDSKEHSEWKWISINELSDIDFIPELKEDIRLGWELYSNNKNILNKK